MFVFGILRVLSVFLSKGDSFASMGVVTNFSNSPGGWSALKYWSTLRLADYDGDGKADICARFAAGLQCMKSTGTGFNAPVMVIAMTDANGWDHPSHNYTLRVGDVSGDGAADFCARSSLGMRCYGMKSSVPFGMVGPAWSNANSWTGPANYQTIMVTDVNPDRRRDLCARASTGLVCSTATDDGFVGIPTLAAFTNAQGFGDVKYYSTLRMGTGECKKAELCNGFDDNCDGRVDEGMPTKMGPVRPKYAARLVEAVMPESAAAGSVVDVSVVFLNEGSAAWKAGELKLEAVSTNQALIDAIRPAQGWESPTVAAKLTAATALSAQGVWTFQVLVPDDLTTFDAVTFALTSPDGSLNCPAPVVKLKLGKHTPVPDADADVGADAGYLDAGAGDANGNDGSSDDLEGDDADGGGLNEEEPKTIEMGSPNSCSAVGVGSASGAPSSGWMGFGLLLGGLYWRRRSKRQQANRGAMMRRDGLWNKLLIVCGVVALSAGCDDVKVVAGEAVTPAVSENIVQVESELTLGSSESAHEKAQIEQAMEPRLMAVYDDWEIEGALTEMRPNSDAPPHYAIKIRHDGKAVLWPLAEQKISSVVFVPPSAGTEDGASGVPSVVARTTVGQLIHVDMETGVTREFDTEAEVLVSAAQNDCCVAYMVGDLGSYRTLKVARFGEHSIDVQRTEVEGNSWSPAISPDGSQVMYTSVSPTGGARICLRNVDDGSSKILVDDAEVFPTGPNAPFWTREGVWFTGETHGVYLLDVEGRTFNKSEHEQAKSVLIDYRSGRALNAVGEVLELKKN